MNKKPAYLLLLVILFACSCASLKQNAEKYYSTNEQQLNHIEQTYNELYNKKPFSVGFTDKGFDDILFEITTDTLKYVYEFEVGAQPIKDTLVKFGFDAPRICEMIEEMKAIKCLWVNKSDYYVDEKKKTFTFISIRPVAINMPFTDKKYYIIIYFTQPQKFSKRGRLLNNRNFRKINEKVCYAFSEKFRN